MQCRRRAIVVRLRHCAQKPGDSVRKLIVLGIALLMTGCVPIGARVQNMYAVVVVALSA